MLLFIPIGGTMIHMIKKEYNLYKAMGPGQYFTVQKFKLKYFCIEIFNKFKK